MSNIVLTKEQKILVDLMQKYKCLRLSQVEVILDHLYRENILEGKESDYDEAMRNLYIDKYLGLLTRKKYLTIDASSYVKIDKEVKPSDHSDTIMAFWVYLSFIKQIDLRENYPASYPSEIFFIKDMQQYEAAYIREGQEYLINMIITDIKKEQIKELEEMVDVNDKVDVSNLYKKYVIGVDSMESIKKIKSYPGLTESDFTNILFVIMKFKDITQEPIRKFVKIND